MPTEYVQDKGIAEALADMLANQRFHELAPLREHEVKIESCLLVRTNTEGEAVECKGEPIKIVKVSPMLQVFMDVDYIVVVDNHAWSTANSKNKMLAMMFNALLQIDVQPADAGGCKKKKRKPNIVLFRETIAHFGAYDDQLIDLRDAFETGAQRVAEELHGNDEQHEEPVEEQPEPEPEPPRRRNRAPAKV